MSQQRRGMSDVYHEEPWFDERVKRADWYENCTQPQRSNMFVRYLLTIMSEQRCAANHEQWRRWRVAAGIES